MQHVRALLDDPRLRIDTTLGSRPVVGLAREIKSDNSAVELKRAMTELNRPDRALQEQMPQGEILDLWLSKASFFGLFKRSVGRLKVVCVSPVRSILAGQPTETIKPPALAKILSQAVPETKVPTTLVVLSTSGFSIEAHELAERRADRTVILIEPNAAGGWDVFGPPETRAVAELFDPEAEAEKRSRIVSMIEAQSPDLSGSGIASDKLAAKAQLPVSFVENQLKQYSKSQAGLTAKRLDGRVVLFRQGQAANGGSSMPLIDRMKSLFSGKGDIEKKIALLSERRAVLSQQRDRAYEEMGSIEHRESALKAEFAQASAEAGKRRITGQILQLRKDLDRRQQLIGVLNQQVEVVSTHLHNLQLLQQGQTAKLPDNDEIVQDAARAEEMLAGLQANVEIATGASASASTSLSAEEQALYEELQGTVEKAQSVGQATSVPNPTAPQAQHAAQKSREAQAE